MEQKDTFALRRTVTILVAIGAVALVGAGIALLAAHRAPPKPALGSGDTTANAVALAMPRAAAPGSPVVSQPAPPGQAVPAAPVAEAGPPLVAPAQTVTQPAAPEQPVVSAAAVGAYAAQSAVAIPEGSGASSLRQDSAAGSVAQAQRLRLNARRPTSAADSGRVWPAPADHARRRPAPRTDTAPPAVQPADSGSPQPTHPGASPTARPDTGRVKPSPDSSG